MRGSCRDLVRELRAEVVGFAGAEKEREKSRSKLEAQQVHCDETACNLVPKSTCPPLPKPMRKM